MEDILIYGLLPIIAGIVIWAFFHWGIKKGNATMVNQLKEKLNNISVGDSYETACQKAGNANETEPKDNGVVYYSWIIRNQYHILYKKTLEFVDNKYTKSIFETEQQ